MPNSLPNPVPKSHPDPDVDALSAQELALVALLFDSERSPRIEQPACHGMWTTWFAPEEGTRPMPRHLERCGSCVERLGCLAFQLRLEAEGERPWVWYGGFGPEQRSVIAARVGRVVHPISEATERRQTVARLAKLGLTQNQIAAELGVCRKTIQRDLAALRREVA